MSWKVFCKTFSDGAMPEMFEYFRRLTSVFNFFSRLYYWIIASGLTIRLGPGGMVDSV